MQKIFININTPNTKLHNYYTESYLDLIKNYNIKVFLFSTQYKKEDLENKEEFEKQNIFLHEYITENELLDEIKKLDENYIIQYVNTFSEDLILLANNIKKELWQKITESPELFRNKSLQRELLLKFDKNITVNYLEAQLEKLNFHELSTDFWLPFILKPKEWVESSGVAKIENKSDFEIYKKDNNTNTNILVEEFIDGEMYSIDYFVDEWQNIMISKPVKVELANKLRINDFFNYSRVISESVEKELEKYNLNTFIKQTIEATWIKNTFIHHEFKFTSKWKLKTIELNGRIWWYRLEMYQTWYWINLFSMVFDEKDYWNKKIINNLATFAIYPEKREVLESYNYELLEQIKKGQAPTVVDVRSGGEYQAGHVPGAINIPFW